MSSIETIETLGHYINGRVKDGSVETLDIYNPATGKVVKRLACAAQPQLEEAIVAASLAFAAWRNTPPSRRAQVLFRFKQLLEANIDEICQAITGEHGKVVDDARGELIRGIEGVEYACGISELLKGEHSKNAGPDIDSWSEFQALGIVAGITPFNFPAMVPMWMFPMAIACGNTFILKPSERDPSASLLLAQLFTEAGLPDGVFNVVNGDRRVVELILDDPRIQAVSFVGSTPVAETIYQRASKTYKRVQALGGAKNHAVIMPDADLENAVNALMGAAYGSCGERCMAISVAVCVGEETADKAVAALAIRVKDLKVGPGTDIENDMGPLISADALERINAYIGQGLDQGAELVVDGRGLKVEGSEDGYFIGGSLFDEVSETMSIHTDEIFGPILCVMRVENLDQAMSIINRHEYGNGTCIFTRDGAAARYFSDHIQVGMVGVNVALPVPVASHSFGGWKRSLFGDLSIYGPDSIRFYTRRKTMTQKWPARGDREGTRFSFPAS